MLTIGLTGGVSSGKSTVAAELARLGAGVVDADRIVAELYSPGGEGAAAVRELLGIEFLDAAGSVRKEAVARRIFSDPASRRALEARIHPLVLAEAGRRLRALAHSGVKIAVLEASQLLEGGFEKTFDRVLLVTAPVELRRRRWLARSLPAADFDRRSAAQISEADARLRADDVIVNEGSPADLAARTGDLFRRYEEETGAD